MRASHLEEYYQFLRFPSVSTDEAYSENVAECAHWLVEKLTAIGLEAKLMPTPGHPVVWAKNEHQPGRKTVMIYGHYDVQPPDPLELWDSPPFEPVLKDGYVFARGATDNKGQILAHILGVQEAIEKDGDLPVNLHFIIEGEEEIGSGNLGNFLSQNLDALKCDVVVISDTGMIAKGTPTLSYGLRGVTALELKVTGPKIDLHSGVFGGALMNPLTALAKMIATLHDKNGRVAIEGFYDKVKPLEDWEREAWRNLPVDVEAEIKKESGVSTLFGEEGYTTAERLWARPTAELNGIGGGYQGQGTKTVLPSHAMAKITFRLVPNQDGPEILELAKKHLRKVCPPGVT
ncbi:MAG: dipeptidase, partial [Chthoniobacterales bacterium]